MTHSDDRLFAGEIESLPDLLAAIWSNLETAAAKGKHGWHLPMIASGGTQPHVRTVVLRQADRESRTIGCHTDVRSPKVTQLRVTPHACWCFYDAANRVQLVAEGTASIHTDDAIAEAGWQRSSVSSRRCYLAPAAPGSVMDERGENLPADLIGKLPDEARTEVGRENFAVIRTRVQRLDFLYLTHTGNLRAEFVHEGDEFTGRWIAA